MKNPHGAATRHDEEPKTPMWLPALGVAFFVGLAIVGATLPDQPAPPASQPSAATAPPTPPSPPPGAVARPAPPQLPAEHP
jgi:hypothetical protein